MTVSCVYRKIYRTINKIGVKCTQGGDDLRITSHMVCEACPDRKVVKKVSDLDKPKKTVKSLRKN